VLAEAITIRDLNDSLVYANRAALRQMGFASLAEAQRRPLRCIMEDYVVHDEHGRVVTTSDLPSVRLLEGHAPDALLMHTVNQVTGEARWERLEATGLRDADGRLIAAVTVIEDVTAVKTAEVQTRVLSESGRSLASSLDYQQTLHNVAHLAVPALADWCVVDLVDENATRTQVVVAGADAKRRELAGRLRELAGRQLDPDSSLGRVFRTGTPELFFELTDEQLTQSAHGEEHLALIRELAIRSAVVVPMRVPARTIGLMAFYTAQSRRRLTHDDLDLAEQLARRAAVAVENSRLYTALAGVAQTLQDSLLPNELPVVPGWEIASLYQPAGAEQRIEVGGDFYEVFDAGNATIALIGDVTGHGIAAATLTSLMRYGARFASKLEPQPAAILRRLDEELRQHPQGDLCTALCARIEPRRLVLCSAGHPVALIVSPDGTVTEAPSPGPLLGAFSDADWQPETVTVEPEQLVLLYTDGVTETNGARERFGTDRLRRLVCDHAGCAPAELLAELDHELARFRAGRVRDDVAALALRPRA